MKKDSDKTSDKSIETSAALSSSEETGNNGCGNIFEDLDALRRRQDFDKLVGAKRQITSVPVAKPGRQMWFRTHPDLNYQISAALLRWEEDETQFFVAPQVYSDLVTEAKRVVLRTVVTPQGSVRLWPIRLPNPDGLDNEWFVSARRVAEIAERQWVRMVANRETRGYDVYTATSDFGEPTWPEQTFADLLKIAFAGKIIDSLDHPVVMKLVGKSR